VFTELARVNFDGPLSVHCEFEAAQGAFLASVKREVQFFRARMREAYR